jgi:hypothetical protein
MSGTKNKLIDLNDHLFAQIERLADEDMAPDKIAAEVQRGKAIVAVADKIIKNAALQVQVAKMVAEKGSIRPLLPSVAGAIESPKPKLIEGGGK